MSEIEREGFSDQEKAASNPFWTYNRLKDTYQWICCRLVRAGGPLGWGDTSLWAAHIKKVEIETLVRSGLVRKAPLWVFAEELLQREEAGEIYLGREPDLNDPEERENWFVCEFARDIVDNKEDPENSEPHYQVARRDLYDFIDMLL